MAVDNSSITGEVGPVPRRSKTTCENFLEADNIAFATSSSKAGEGKGVVLATGNSTLMGLYGSLSVLSS
jgi:sodium/potassium-transporting ATPase subunit alpha